MSNNNNFWSGAIIGALIFAFLPLGKDKELPTKTVYVARCNDDKHSIYDCPNKLSVLSETYKVFIEQQMVISSRVYTLDAANKKCTVFDENNWRCENGTFWQSMIDGHYTTATGLYVTEGIYADEDGKSSHPQWEQISTIQYWWHRIKGVGVN